MRLRKGIPTPVVEAVWARARGWCERCDLPELGKMDLHHRLMRSQGGPDTVANLLWCHHDCHMEIHRETGRAYELGFLLRSGTDPEVAPLPKPVASLKGPR